MAVKACKDTVCPGYELQGVVSTGMIWSQERSGPFKLMW